MKSIALLVKLFALALSISACAAIAPARVPSQLSATAGPVIRIDGSHYDAGAFQVDYPTRWKIVKLNTAAAPQEVVFANPANPFERIHIKESPLDAYQAQSGESILEEIIQQAGEPAIYLRAHYETGHWETFAPVWQLVRDSLAN
ncbi:hypothetical protein MASR2M15_21190 [Anaerolineales bacterium]